MNVQWFPGHMAKAKREIRERLSLVDVVIELRDARAPEASSGADFSELIEGKPFIIALNKSDLADVAETEKWIARCKEEGVIATPIFCTEATGDDGFKDLKKMITNAAADKKARDTAKGIINRAVRILVVGIPNVGKSAFINKFAGRATMKVGNRPGVTLAQQWIKVNGASGESYDLLDTPGILPPKFQTEEEGLALAWIGSIKDEIYDTVEAAVKLCEFLSQYYEKGLRERFKLTDELADGYDIFLEIGKKRGCVVSGGEIDEQRTAGIILDEFRAGRLGGITVERA